MHGGCRTKVEGLKDFQDEYEAYKERAFKGNYYPEGRASQIAFYSLKCGRGK